MLILTVSVLIISAGCSGLGEEKSQKDMFRLNQI
jgi:hypothetical protein